MRLPLTCPGCGRVNDVHDSIGPPAVPEPGDVTMCAHCGGLAIVVTAATLRAPTPDELTDLLDDARVQAAIAALAVADDIDQAVELARRTHARSN